MVFNNDLADVVPSNFFSQKVASSCSLTNSFSCFLHLMWSPSRTPSFMSASKQRRNGQTFEKQHTKFNSPYACLRQTSKFHHQVSFSKYKVAKFCINEFPGQYSWKEYPRIKSANAKNFAFKRGLVVKFARLTQSRIRAIPKTVHFKILNNAVWKL